MIINNNNNKKAQLDGWRYFTIMWVPNFISSYLYIKFCSWNTHSVQEYRTIQHVAISKDGLLQFYLKFIYPPLFLAGLLCELPFKLNLALPVSKHCITHCFFVCLLFHKTVRNALCALKHLQACINSSINEG